MTSKILIGVLLLSLLGNMYLFSQVQAQSSTTQTATELATSLQAYFQAADHRCNANPNNLGEMTTCLNELISQRTGLATIEKDEFEDVDEREGDAGYLIVKNTGEESLNSSAFTLLKNKNEADTNCQINGSIDSGYTCRLDFTSPCEPGDVLEVQYQQKQAYLETC